MAGMQVSLIFPTTLLARQHHMNFEERFKGFPLKIGHLSRLVTASEAKAVKEGLTDGTTDIVVGTHALLAKGRSEEHTSELQSLMRISYAVFCLKKKKTT